MRGLQLETPRLIIGLIDNLEKCSLLSNFHYSFRASRWTAHLLTVVSDRVVWAFNRSVATLTVTLDIFKTYLPRFCMLIFDTKSSLTETNFWCLALICCYSSIKGFKWFCMERFCKNIMLMLVFHKVSFSVLNFS